MLRLLRLQSVKVVAMLIVRFIPSKRMSRGLLSKGLLIEQQSTNRLTNSNNFNNYAQNPASSITVTPNSGIAPDGTNTAFKGIQ